MELRPYQKEAVEAIYNEWNNNNKHTLLVACTGSGKTSIFSEVIKKLPKNERVLSLAHREELLQQAKERIESHTGFTCGIEKAGNSTLQSGEKVVLGSIQTLWKDKRLDLFPSDAFDTIVVDEAHHSVSDGYMKVLNHFPNAKVLGVTATPDRGDHKALADFYDSIAYEYPLRRAIKEGYLCKLKAQTIPLELDISNVKMSQGDYSPGELGHAIEPYLDQIASKMVDICMNRKTIVFLPLVSTSKLFVDILNKHGFKAVEVNAKTKNRTQVLKDFEDGKYNVLCNALLVTEGVDIPCIDTVVCLRPTRIRSLFTQVVGRATRLYPGKEYALILDFLWLTKKHGLCHPASLVAENEEIAERMTENMADGGVYDIEESEQDAIEELMHERENALVKSLWQQLGKPAKMFDPLEYIDETEAGDLFTYSPVFKWENERVTERQRDYLLSKGIFVTPSFKKGAASKLIQNIIDRQRAGLASPKQVKLLINNGYYDAIDYTFEKANAIITQLSKNWRRY